ncbi:MULTISPECIES: TetR/AcrR family transcriptional regulator [Microbacterium]|uniref:TetR/AcrR family transcriptional regulator n=1 Tax=Microbacterium TaxID=33882 RepID=UPI002789B54A|nr:MULTISPECIES: TetR/AcrR family transcriptional regulator [Microbacterium]MDQ1083341.1 AcrR family transcriptional regulator [Microbacterium sp. SORGH_AS_0344]MDQ1171379.1 AcrR family transcriptional regulator [Microbacterium proteolyticum]
MYVKEDVVPRASAADAALTADSILRAATDAFAEAGYQRASVGQIAGAAGVTRGAVHHHFSDKLGLFQAVVRAGHERVAAAIVARASTQSADPRAALRAGCHAFVDAITGDAAARILLVEGPAVLGWSTWRALDASTSMKELQEAVQEVTDGDALALTRLLSGAMNEGVLWLIETPENADARASVHRALDRLIDAL